MQTLWRIVEIHNGGGSGLNWDGVVLKFGSRWWFDLEVFTGGFNGWELGRSDNTKTSARNVTGLTPLDPPCLC